MHRMILMIRDIINFSATNHSGLCYLVFCVIFTEFLQTAQLWLVIAACRGL